MAKKKSTPEAPLESPIAFHPCSNGEYCPTPETDRDHLAARRFRELVDEHRGRLGMTRREYIRSACGTAAALIVINQVYGCGGAGSGAEDAAVYDVSPNAMVDAELACETLEGDEFIFDIQVHTASPLAPWRDDPVPMTASDFIRTVFVDSDTTVACLSGISASRNLGVAHVEARQQIQDIIDRIGGPRLLYHVNVDPLRGPGELDFMEQAVASEKPSAWKVYPHVGPWRLDDSNGLAFVEKARQLDVKLIAAHRGIGADAGGYADASSPIDLVRAARMTPDVAFITYHSGWERNIDEDHPFDPQDANPHGVDRLIKAMLDEGLAPNSNVYAELGSTWRNLMTAPNAAAHVLGKLLLYVGEDRVVWGTDSVFTGSPTEQIVAMRTFQIPASMQAAHGYPALTDSIRAKIFGLNAAAAYGVDPEATLCAIRDDHIDQLRTARLVDPEAVPVPTEKRWGPRNRREFLRFLSWEKHLEG